MLPVIEKPGDPTPVFRPSAIDISDGLAGLFSHPITDRSAARLVEFFQQSDLWLAFDFRDWQKFCRSKKIDSKEFLYGLVGLFYENGPNSPIKHAGPYIFHMGNKFAVTRSFLSEIGQRLRIV